MLAAIPRIIVQPTLVAAIALPLLLILAFVLRRHRPRYILLALLFMIALNVVFWLAQSFVPMPAALADSSAPWRGKLANLLLALGVALASDALRQETGLGTGFRRSDLGAIGGAGLVLAGVVLVIVARGANTSVSLENYLFQLTLPGPAEEIAHRGVILALLNRVFSRNVTVLGAKVGIGLLASSVLFGLLHGAALTKSYEVTFSLYLTVLTGSIGLVLGWIKERTASIWPAVVLHNAYNVLFVAASDLAS